MKVDINSLSFNVGNAVSNIINTTKTRPTNGYTGWCTRHVNWAVKAGGIDLDKFGLSHADPPNFYKSLGQVGFSEVHTMVGDANHKDPVGFQPKMGDIAIFWGLIRSGNKKCWHSCMYSGEAWYSDCRQTSMYCYGSVPGSEKVHILRFTGRITNFNVTLAEYANTGGTGDSDIQSYETAIQYENQDVVLMDSQESYRRSLIGFYLGMLGMDESNTELIVGDETTNSMFDEINEDKYR